MKTHIKILQLPNLTKRSAIPKDKYFAWIAESNLPTRNDSFSHMTELFTEVSHWLWPHPCVLLSCPVTYTPILKHQFPKLVVFYFIYLFHNWINSNIWTTKLSYYPNVKEGGNIKCQRRYRYCEIHLRFLSIYHKDKIEDLYLNTLLSLEVVPVWGIIKEREFVLCSGSK